MHDLQVLGEVEAHLNVLRVQLQKGTPRMNSAIDKSQGGLTAGISTLLSANAPRGCGYPVAATSMASTDAAANADDAVGLDAASGLEPPIVESRGNYHLSANAEQRSGNGLTEVEDMRLTRLLRSCASSSSPPSTLAPSESITPVLGQPEEDENGGIGIVLPGHNSSDNAVGWKAGGGDRSVSVMPGSNGGVKNLDASVEGHLDGSSGVARKLFGESIAQDSQIPGGEGQSRRSSQPHARGGYKAPRGGTPLTDEDDLDDISDGGFHSGCWRRKYVRGDMR